MAVEVNGTKPPANVALLVTSGDLRVTANQVCWPAQKMKWKRS